MLDQETKRKIDNARDILVGKVPDPKSQVEQITIALTYKFMDDMDRESEEWGGKASFFKGEYAKYTWSKVFDRRIGGFELISLYSEAIVKMNQNPNIPQLFRDIFKNAYLPYRDPETLKSFLKEINEFKYDQSERLGDAYEYLLSIMDKQGEAGQFRTPRHIIDFIVEIVDPKKNEIVLDPACGTAGFLISSYKHILKANTKHRPGDKLTPDERKRLLSNFAGYDISPDMVRLSLVNMYLHGFSAPKIVEYDTLTSEERWNDTSDVVMANPPFMTPKGGIRPHKRFSIQAKRSEVLFVDYIAEHLNPHGRAGVIVPEGIIFQSQTAYKNLRKMLVEGFLWAVASLPAGVFNPYAGVKTSVLFMDKALAKKVDKILFVKVENDGFDLGAQRRPIDKNDIPRSIAFMKDYLDAFRQNTEVEKTEFAWPVEKAKIGENGDWNLSGERYKLKNCSVCSDYPSSELGDVAEVISGQSPDGKFYNSKGLGIPFYQGKTEFTEMYIGPPRYWTTETTKKAEEGDILMSVRAPVGPVNLATQTICIGRGLAAIRPGPKLDRLFLFYFLKTIQDEIKGGGGSVFDSISAGQVKAITLPLPPLDVQKAIVAEIDNYQRIIDGARQVVENYKPTIKVDPEWPILRFKDAPFEIIDGDRGTNYPKKEDFSPSGYCLFLNTKNVRSDGFNFSAMEFVSKENDQALRKGKLQRGDVVLTTRGTIGNTGIYDESVRFDNIRINSGMLIFRPDTGKLAGSFLFHFFQSENFRTQRDGIISGAAQPQLPIRSLNEATIPIPPLATQQQIVTKIEAEQEAVNATKKLISIFEQKIKDTISEIWGESHH